MNSRLINAVEAMGIAAHFFSLFMPTNIEIKGYLWL
jgi:hypothetical protein